MESLKSIVKPTEESARLYKKHQMMLIMKKLIRGGSLLK